MMGADAEAFLPDESELLSRLQLNATDAARVCGVTVRQLTYWTDRGLVPTVEGDARSYGESALRRVLAIKELMLQGYTLEKAAHPAQVGAEMGAPEVGLDYLDVLGAAVRSFTPRLKAYLALGRARRAAVALLAVNLDSCFDGNGDELAAARLGAVLDGVAGAVNEALASLSCEALAEGAAAEAVPA